MNENFHDFHDSLHSFVRCVTDSSGGRVRRVHREEDQTSQRDETAAHFLKLDGRRLGRNLEVYEFMARVMGEPAMLGHLLMEIIFPIKKEAWSKPCSDYLKEWGVAINEPENLAAWTHLFHEKEDPFYEKEDPEMELSELLTKAHALLDEATVEDGLGFRKSAVARLISLRTLLNERPDSRSADPSVRRLLYCGVRGLERLAAKFQFAESEGTTLRPTERKNKS